MIRLLPLLAVFATAPLLAQQHREVPADHAPSRPALVGYLPQWGLYGTPPWSVKQLVTSGSARLLTQVNYAQAFIKDGRCSVADPNADLQHPYDEKTSVDGTADAPDPAPGTPPGPPVLRGEFHQLQELSRQFPHLRKLISIEGNAAGFADAAQPDKRTAFVASCIDIFLRGNLGPGLSAPGLFDGIDVDWEYPNGTGTSGVSDGANFAALLLEFRRQLDAYGAATHTHPMLSIASGAGLGRYPGVDWPLIARTVDQVGLMNYDYNGPWQKMTGIIAPLYSITGLQLESGNIDNTVQGYEAAGVPASKLLMGVPFYGYHWSQVVDAGAQHGLGTAGKPEHSDSPYRDIRNLPGAATPFRDEHSQAPWIYDGNNFWTFDDPTSATAKATYARDHQMGGMMVWELSGDTDDGVMMKALQQGLAPAATGDTRKAAAVAEKNTGGKPSE